MRHAATVLSVGVPQLVDKAKEIAARVLETKPEEIEWSDGRLSAPGTNVTFNLLELAREAEARGLPQLNVRTDNEMHDPVFPNGCAVCEVEVDPDTGWVDITRYAASGRVPGRRIAPFELFLGDKAADQRKCVRVHAGRRQADQDVANRDVVARQDFVALDGADAEAGEIVVLRLVHARAFRRFRRRSVRSRLRGIRRRCRR